MTPEEIQAQMDEILLTSQEAINRWHSHAGITPEINKELSNITSMIPAITFLMFGGHDTKFTNVAKCVVEAAFQYGRRHPIAELNWIVREDETIQ